MAALLERMPLQPERMPLQPGTMPRSKRMALLAGCNYAGKSCELSGCINDVKAVKELLKTRFDFEESSITLLIDEQGTPIESQPTGQNIKDQLSRMGSDSKQGDLLLFYFSGHGTKLEFPYELRGEKAEAIVPSDFNLITRYDFRAVLDEADDEATFAFISDSCHSGGLIDKEPLRIRDLSFETERPTAINQETQDIARKAKKIDHEQLKEILETDDVSEHLKQKFKLDASNFLHKNKRKRFWTEIKEDMGILISACRSEEVSYDLKEGLGRNGRAHGAFTSALLHALQGCPNLLTNREIVESVRNILLKNNFDQHSCLYCAHKNTSAVFLLQQREATTTDPEVLPLSIAPSRDAKHLDAGIFVDIQNAALVYYRVSSDSTKDKFKTWFNKLDVDHDKKVKALDVYNVLIRKNKCDSRALTSFVINTVGWETYLDLNQCLGLYYASKSFVKFCRKCENYLKSHYFVCVSCFRTAKDEFAICADCLTKGMTCGKHDHKQFLDNHALLRYLHLKELKSSKDYHPEPEVPMDINNYLEDAETSLKRQFDLGLTLSTDICTIM